MDQLLCFHWYNLLAGCGDLTNGSDPYGLYHTFHAYKTTDFTTFENLGVALSLDARQPGIVFRPSVIYNPKTKLFVMWFEDRGSVWCCDI